MNAESPFWTGRSHSNAAAQARRALVDARCCPPSPAAALFGPSYRYCSLSLGVSISSRPGDRSYVNTRPLMPTIHSRALREEYTRAASAERTFGYLGGIYAMLARR